MGLRNIIGRVWLCYFGVLAVVGGTSSQQRGHTYRPVTFLQKSSIWHNHQSRPYHQPWHHTTQSKRSPRPQEYTFFPSNPQNTYNIEEYQYEPLLPNYEGRALYPFGENNDESGRLISSSALTKFSETLGALNTVGHFLVDRVSEKDKKDEEKDEHLSKIPEALLTLSKNVLGRNVTETIAPFVSLIAPQKAERKEEADDTPTNKVLPLSPVTNKLQVQPLEAVSLTKITTDVQTIQESDKATCTTPEGKTGVCDDLSNCPQLLLNLGALRESFCFKDLFVPGVCCPEGSIKPTTTSKPTYLIPVTTQKPTTKKPTQVLTLTTKKPSTQRPAVRPKPPTITSKPTTSRPATTTFITVPPPVITNISNIVNSEECGQREDESGRIVGGTEAKSGSWPWMAAIFLHGAKRKEFWCGGSLVGPRHVLTAAHCTRDSKQRQFPARQFTVRLGDVDLASTTEPSRPVTARVVEVRAHDQFSRVGFYNDIALLILADPVQKNKYVIPLCLPGPNLARHLFEGSTATVVGWGTTRYGGVESSRQLEAKLPVWSNADCDRAYFQPITENFICAGYAAGGTDACQGDSGGPLMLSVGGRWTQIGVVSFGNKCGEPGYPGVYTRLTHYTHWIDNHLRQTGGR